MAGKNTSNGTKAIVALFVLLAALGTIIMAVSATMKPLKQQQDMTATMLRDHAEKNNHPWGVMAELGEMRQRFVEVETQFRGLREIIEIRDENHKERIAKLEEWYNMVSAMNARRDEKLKVLERKVFNEKP